MTAGQAVRFGVLSFAVLAMAASLPSASASVIGHLTVTNCSGGGVTVSATLIDFLPGSPTACLQAGAGTSITSSSTVLNGPNLTPASMGTINDLPSPPPTDFAGFMTFNGGLMKFDLVTLGPGVFMAPGCTTSILIGMSCSVTSASPFILTATSSNGVTVDGTSVTLLARGTVFDNGDKRRDPRSGSFTTQISETPAQIQSTILAGGSITNTFSGTFDAVAPEPLSMAMIGGGLILLAGIKRQKRA